MLASGRLKLVRHGIDEVALNLGEAALAQQFVDSIAKERDNEQNDDAGEYPDAHPTQHEPIPIWKVDAEVIGVQIMLWPCNLRGIIRITPALVLDEVGKYHLLIGAVEEGVVEVSLDAAMAQLLAQAVAENVGVYDIVGKDGVLKLSDFLYRVEEA